MFFSNTCTALIITHACDTPHCVCPLLKHSSVKVTVCANTAAIATEIGELPQAWQRRAVPWKNHWRKWQHKACFWTSNWCKMLPPGQIPQPSGFSAQASPGWEIDLSLFPLRRVGVKIRKKLTGARQEPYVCWKGSPWHLAFLKSLISKQIWLFCILKSLVLLGFFTSHRLLVTPGVKQFTIEEIFFFILFSRAHLFPLYYTLFL